MEIPASILKKINERKANNAFRSLHIRSKGIDFYSNDYLGMAQVATSSSAAHGATGSRLISGHFEITADLEKKCASFFKQQDGLLYNSGYDANLGVFSAIPQRNDTVIYDELCHASIRDGIRLGVAKSYAFKHNNLADLKTKLEKAEGTIYVAIESVYSMDGDCAPLKEMADLCKKYKAYLIVDEAHGGGVFGRNGEGLATELGVDEDIFIKIITFGKAFGSHGAVVLTANTVKDYLVNFSRPLIYTTALSPNAQNRISSCIDCVSVATDARKKLNTLIAYFQTVAYKHKLPILKSNSPIQAILIEGNRVAKEKAEELNEKGFAVKAILSPTVPKGAERIRICLHSYNTKKEIENLIKALQ